MDGSRLAVTGFCWGGRWVWLTCEKVAQVKVGVSWYGQMNYFPGAPAGPDQMLPINFVKDLHAPVLGLNGGLDKLSETVPAMRAALAAAHKDSSEIIIYPEAKHGVPCGLSRRLLLCRRRRTGWNRILQRFFAEHGAPPEAAPLARASFQSTSTKSPKKLSARP